MKHIAGLLMIGLIFTTSGIAVSEETKVSAEAGLDAYSQYVWRGQNLADKFSLQPSVTFGFGETGVSFNVWGSLAVQDRGTPNNLDKADEFDFTVGFDRILNEESGVGISLGFIQYTFPNAVSGSQHSEEFYGGISVGNLAAPSLMVYHDFGLIDATYLSLGISPEIPLDQEGLASLSIGINLAFSNYGGTGNKEFGFNDFTISTAVSFGAGAFSISPVFGYSYGDDRIITKTDNGEVWGGISIGISN